MTIVLTDISDPFDVIINVSIFDVANAPEFPIRWQNFKKVFISYFMLSTNSNFSEVTNTMALVGMILQTPSKYLKYGVSSKDADQEFIFQYWYHR